MTPRHSESRKPAVTSSTVKALGVVGLALTGTVTSIAGASAAGIATQSDLQNNTFNVQQQSNWSYSNDWSYGNDWSYSNDWYQPTGWNNTAWNGISGWDSWGSWNNPATDRSETPEANQPAETSPSSATPVADNNQSSFDFVYQRQGQPYGDIDCGPSVLLMALNHAGKSPSYYNPNDMASNLVNMRAEAIHNGSGYLSTNEIPSVLSRYGLQSTSYIDDDAQAAVDQIKQGKRAIALGQTGIVGPEDGASGYGHYVYVSGYNSNTGMFTVANPLNSNHSTVEINEDTLRQFLYSNLRVNPNQNLIVF